MLRHVAGRAGLEWAPVAVMGDRCLALRMMDAPMAIEVAVSSVRSSALIATQFRPQRSIADRCGSESLASGKSSADSQTGDNFLPAAPHGHPA